MKFVITYNTGVIKIQCQTFYGIVSVLGIQFEVILSNRLLLYQAKSQEVAGPTRQFLMKY